MFLSLSSSANVIDFVSSKLFKQPFIFGNLITQCNNYQHDFQIQHSTSMDFFPAECMLDSKVNSILT